MTPTAMAASLAKRLAEHGFQASMSIDSATDGLDPIQMITLARVMQKATTNILRYAAAGTACSVSIRVIRGSIAVEIPSELCTTPRRSAMSNGWGLRGLRERADLLSGSFRAGARHGTWVVEMELPPSAPNGALAAHKR